MDESRFDWPAIFRATAIVVVITAVFGFAVPIGLAFALGLPDTRQTSGNEIYRWLFWILAWVLIFWQARMMLNDVGERIIDDMLVTSVVVAILLLIVRFVIALVYTPVNSRGEILPLITAIDAMSAVLTGVVALIAARLNQY